MVDQPPEPEAAGRAPGAARVDAVVRSSLRDGAERLGVPLRPDQVVLIESFLSELVRWSAKMSLTALDTPRGLVQEGVLDSLACAPHVPAEMRLVVDVGSGAGFPAIPLAVALPQHQFTLIEAARKKTTFLRHIVRTLGLTNATVWHGRAEAYDGPSAGRFDVAFARAAAPLPAQSALAAGLLRAGGIFIAQTTTEVASATLGTVDVAAFLLVQRIPCPPSITGHGRELCVLRRT